MDIINNIIKIIESILKLNKTRYNLLKQINLDNPNNQYKNVIKKELEVDDFQLITGVYTSPNKQKDFLNFYKKHQNKLNMKFSEFVSAHNYIKFNDDKLSINLKCYKWIYIFGFLVLFLLIIPIIIFTFIDFHNTYYYNLPIILISLLCTYIILKISITLTSPYEIAKKLKKLDFKEVSKHNKTLEEERV